MKKKRTKEWIWTHFICEAYCLYDLSNKSSGALVSNKVKIKPPKHCKVQGQPELDKCLYQGPKGVVICPHLGICKVEKDEYNVMMKAWWKLTKDEEKKELAKMKKK